MTEQTNDMSAKHALDELKSIWSAETNADVVRAVRELASHKPLIWMDGQGKIGFAPMTYRAVVHLIEALERGVVSP